MSHLPHLKAVTAAIVTAVAATMFLTAAAAPDQAPTPADDGYCAVGTAPMVDGEQQPVQVDCFGTEAELWLFLTGSRLNGDEITKPLAATYNRLADLGATPQAAAASVLLGTEYDSTGYTGASTALYGTSGSGCAGGATYGFPNMGNYGFNDRISSAIAYSGCRSQHYNNDSYGGSSTTCSTSCYSMGALDNITSSIVFRP